MTSIKLTHREIDLNQECNELCQEYKIQMKKTHGLKESRGRKGIYITPIETEILKNFCEENNTNIPEIIRSGFFHLGAITDSYVIALKDQPKADIKFVTRRIDELTFNYLSDYKDFTKEDFEEKFNETGLTKTIQDRSILITEVEIFRKTKTDYPTWAKFAKNILFSIGIYPPLAVEVSKKHFKVEAKELSTAQLIINKKRQEVNVMNLAAPKQKIIGSVKLALSYFTYEKNHYITPFFDALRKENLTFSGLVKAELLNQNIVSNDLINMKKEVYRQYKNFSYERDASITVEHEPSTYIRQKRLISNISFLTPARDVIFNAIGKGNFSLWVRKNILLKYKIYSKDEEENERLMKNFSVPR